MSDNIKLCASCNTQFDDSCGNEDSVSGLWYCEACGDKIFNDQEIKPHAEREDMINRFRDRRGPGEY